MPLVDDRAYLARLSPDGRWVVLAEDALAGQRLRIHPYEMYAPPVEVIRIAEERWGADVL
jgi:hypothetical protein